MGRAIKTPGRGGYTPEKTTEYLQPEYWNKRFEDEEQYDWLKGYEEFRHLMRPHLKQKDKILLLGCGNSTLTMDLWKDGFKDIVSIDLSETVIERMREKAAKAGMDSLEWQVADMLDLPYEDSYFDAVIEKGTLDVLLVDNKNPWAPQDEVCERVQTTLQGVHRVLKPDGMFLSVTFAQPHFRCPFLTAPAFDWSVNFNAFGTTFHYYVYAMKRGRREAQTGNTGNITYEPAKHATEDGTTHAHMEGEDYLNHIDV